MRKYSHVKQIDEKDCGVACIATLLKVYNSEMPLSKLRELSGTNVNGTSAFGMKKCLNTLNFDCEVIRTERSFLESSEITFPVIAHLLVKDHFFHYVVIHGIVQNKLIVSDPAAIGLTKIEIAAFEQEWTGILFTVSPKDSYIPKKEKLQGFASSFRILKKEWKLIGIISALALVATLFGISTTFYLQKVIDDIIPRQDTSMLTYFSFALLIGYVLQTILEYGRSCLLLKLGQRLSSQVIMGYLQHVIRLPLHFFVTRKAGEILSRFTDASKIIEALAATSLSLVLDIGMVICVGIVLAIQSPALFLITLVALPLYTLVILGFSKAFNRMKEEEMRAGGELNSEIIQTIKGIETLKAHDGEKQIARKIEQSFNSFMTASIKSQQFSALQNSLKLMIQTGNSLLVLWLGSSLIIQGELSLGQLITFNALLVFFTTPLQNIINLQLKIQAAQVASTRLNEVMSLPLETKDDKVKTNVAWNKSLGIHMENVSFAYGWQTNVLEQVNLSISPGKKVAIVGGSGSGKSTLAKLMVNFYELEEGAIRLGEHNIKDISKTNLRNIIGYVSQESFFFQGSILSNLLLGLEEKPDMDTVYKACVCAGLEEDLKSFSLGLQSRIEEGGSNLSGGQKQRFAIARALLKNPAILLLDESTSAIDSETEKKVISNLLGLDTTVIFITHNLKISQECDEVIVVDQGRIVQNGSHDLLAFTEGKYKEFWVA